MKASEKEALVHECLIKNYEKYYRMAYSYVFCEQDAMDIVQEGAYRAILKSDLLKQPEYVDTWICKIVINEALRFLKKNKLTSVIWKVYRNRVRKTRWKILIFREPLINWMSRKERL